jgi:hypothetical protein
LDVLGPPSCIGAGFTVRTASSVLRATCPIHPTYIFKIPLSFAASSFSRSLAFLMCDVWLQGLELTHLLAMVRRLEKLSDLPPDIVDRYQRKQFLLKLGLFPEISRVWCVVDTDFFMWHAKDYAADFQAVTNISEVITAVALVRSPMSRPPLLSNPMQIRHARFCCCT